MSAAVNSGKGRRGSPIGRLDEWQAGVLRVGNQMRRAWRIDFGFASITCVQKQRHLFAKADGVWRRVSGVWTRVSGVWRWVSDVWRTVSPVVNRCSVANGFCGLLPGATRSAPHNGQPTETPATAAGRFATENIASPGHPA